MDRYSNVIYLTPMVLGAFASVFAAAWRFLGVRSRDTGAGLPDEFWGLSARIRRASDEATLSAIEAEIDFSLRARLAGLAQEEDAAAELTMLIAAMHRLDNLVHHRRMMLVSAEVADPEIGVADLFASDEANASRTERLPVI